jgi:polyisoprenoid-binding protein YceI
MAGSSYQYPAPAAARTYAIDKTHSEIVFQVRYLVTRVRGRFTDFEGKVELDPLTPEKSSVNAALETGGFLVGDEVKISASVQAIAQ